MTHGSRVTPTECRDWRTEATDTTASTIAESTSFTVHTVRYHVYGRCACPVDVDPPDRAVSDTDGGGDE